MRFYDTCGGDIFLDDVPIKQIDIKKLRDCFGLVGQENFLFNLSIEENIKYASIAANDETILSPEMADAMSFIK